MLRRFRKWLLTTEFHVRHPFMARLDKMIKLVGLYVCRFVKPPAWPRNQDGRVYINLGCGTISHPAFINVDANVNGNIHYVRPIQNLRVFKDNYADLIYASHCLEHFGHREVRAVLREWYRVIKPEGVLRLGVPDFDKLLDLYKLTRNNLAEIQEFLMGGQTYRLNSHGVVFNESSLTALLYSVGFREVRPWKRNADELTSLADCTGIQVMVYEDTGNVAGDLSTAFDDDGRMKKVICVSLNLEAIK
jgi:SAM-dependent methyltransferase